VGTTIDNINASTAFTESYVLTPLRNHPAYVELPDGKVLSGAEWGNLLLWDGGFIKLEFSRKGKKSCHNVRTSDHI